MKKFLTLFLALFVFVATLTGCGKNANRVVIYTAAEEERIGYLQKELNAKFPDYDIIRIDAVVSVDGEEKELSAAVKR